MESSMGPIRRLPIRRPIKLSVTGPKLSVTGPAKEPARGPINKPVKVQTT